MADTTTTIATLLSEGIVPEKSQEDDRNYLMFQLSNGLNCMVCSDPECDKSAAAMSVEVGHFSDPDEVPGLAHFCEHMLFLGTEKYPDESSYKEFLKSNGGRSNAYTSADHTCYFFDVNQQHLVGALDRFAAFFTCPLFTESCVDRELNAVNNEHEKNLQTDGRKLYQLDKHLATPDHVFHKFATGNLKTLQIPDIRDQLLTFYNANYSASIMSLGLIGRQSVEELKQICENMFFDIPSSGKAFDKFPGNAYPGFVSTEQAVASVKDIRRLYVTFPCPSQNLHFRERPTTLLGHLLGDESPGSVLAYLKERGWANELSAGSRYNFESFGLFAVTIDLTEEGIKVIPDVVQVVFEYIKLMEGISHEQMEMYWMESQKLRDITFRFKGKEASYGYCKSLSRALQNVAVNSIQPGRDLPLALKYANGQMYDFNAELISDFMGCLRPDNVTVRIVSQQALEGDVQQEPWYDTNYTTVPLSNALLERFQNVEPRPELKLAEMNPLIPTNFTILDDELQNEHPSVIEHPNVKLWFKNDDKYLKPKASLLFRVVNPRHCESPKMVNLCYVYELMVRDALQELTYQCELAGLKGKMTVSAQSSTFSFAGYNDKLKNLIDIILNKLSNLDLREDRFLIQKERLVRYFRNYWLGQPYSQLRTNYANTMLTQEFGTETLQASLEELTFQDVCEFVPQVYNGVFVEALSHGNITREQTLEYVNQFCEGLQLQALPAIQRLGPSRLFTGEPSHELFAVKTTNPNERNSAVHTSFEIGMDGPDRRLLAQHVLFGAIANAPAFAYLRTEKQLGYIVWSSADSMRGSLRFVFIVQSSEFSPNHMDGEIETFLQQFHQTLCEMDPEAFAEKREGKAIDLLKKVKTLYKMTDRYWAEIRASRYDFNHKQLLAEAVRNVTKEDLIDYMNTYVVADAPKRTKFSNWFFGTEQELGDFPENAACRSSYEEFNAWRANLEHYPYPYPRSTNVTSNL